MKLRNILGLFRRKAQSAIPILDSRTPAERMVDEFNMELKCPCCEDRDCFLEGPSGGMCTNVMCTSCGSRFNHSLFGLEWTHGPQPNIWNKVEQTKFPTAEHVAKVKEALER